MLRPSCEAHFYEVYATKDDRFVAVGAIERQFYALLLKGLGLDAATLPPQLDRASWPAMKQRLADVFRTRSRDEWAQLFAGSDACVSPVLTPEEAAAHPHAQARKSFVSAGTVQRPVPAPRFSRSAASEAGAAPHSGEHTDRVLLEFGFSGKEIESMRSSGAVA